MSSSSRRELGEAFARFAEMMSWFTLPGGDGVSPEKVRLVLAEWDEQIAPHLDCISAVQREVIETKVNPRVERLRAKLRLLFLETLGEALVIRIDWLLADEMTRVPAKLRALEGQGHRGLAAILARTTGHAQGGSYQPAALFWEGEQRCEAAEGHWKKKLAEFHCHWHEDFSAAVESRLENADLAGLRAWQAEVAAGMQAILRRYPELAGALRRE